MTIALEPTIVDLPTVDYETAPGPAEAHRRLAVALSQGPVVMGAHGPEILSYDLARTALTLGLSAEAAEAAARARRHFAAKGHLPAVRLADAVAGLCAPAPRHGAGREASR